MLFLTIAGDRIRTAARERSQEAPCTMKPFVSRGTKRIKKETQNGQSPPRTLNRRGPGVLSSQTERGPVHNPRTPHTIQEERQEEMKGKASNLQAALLLLGSRFFALSALDCGFPCTNPQAHFTSAVQTTESTFGGELNTKRFVSFRCPSLCYQHNSRSRTLVDTDQAVRPGVSLKTLRP